MSIPSYQTTESFSPYVNTNSKLFEKQKEKSVADGLSSEPLLVMGQTRAHPSLTFVLLKTIPYSLSHCRTSVVLQGAVRTFIHRGAQLIGRAHLLQGDSVSPHCDACWDVILACCHDLVLLVVLIEAEMDISGNYSFCKIL